MKRLCFFLLLIISTTGFSQQRDNLSSLMPDTASMYKYRDEQGKMRYEQAPAFPGGEEAMCKYINDHLVYPKRAFKKGIQGKVYVQFVVERDGSVSNVKVVKGVHRLLNKEAIRLIANMPKWVPGWANGEVRVTFTLPLTFKLTTPTPQSDPSN
ncbi:MAG: energy transducer TonB [Lewinellaceae bacterium]|nr:energy transducer TonB [Lewinellaceae bacterium]